MSRSTTGAQARLEAIWAVLKCSDEVACERLGKVVADVDDGRTELLGLDVTQECINPADKKEVTQYIESAASKALDIQETKPVLRETRQRVAKQARIAPAVGRNRKASIIESDHDWAEQDLKKYLSSRGRLTKDIFSRYWHASSGARWSCARS